MCVCERNRMCLTDSRREEQLWVLTHGSRTISNKTPSQNLLVLFSADNTASMFLFKHINRLQTNLLVYDNSPPFPSEHTLGATSSRKPLQPGKLFYFILFFYFTILYWFCHTLTWIHHRCTWVPNPEPPSHHPPHIISLGHPSAPAASILYPVSNPD